MKINKKRFLGLFLLFNLVFLIAGCSASWLGAISALLPGLEAAVSAIVSFVLALEGKTIPASVSQAIQKWGSNAATLIANIKSIIASVTGAVTQGVVAEIQAGFAALQSSTQAILNAFAVTDPSTVSKFTNLVGILVTVVTTILGLIPLATKAVSGAMTKEEMETADKSTASELKNTHKIMQETYKSIVTTPTENADVNTALEALPQSLP